MIITARGPKAGIKTRQAHVGFNPARFNIRQDGKKIKATYNKY